MTPGCLTVSQRELDRTEWIRKIRARRATQAQVAERLALTLLKRDDMLERRVTVKQKKAGWNNDCPLLLLTRGIA